MKKCIKYTGELNPDFVEKSFFKLLKNKPKILKINVYGYVSISWEYGNLLCYSNIINKIN